MMRTIVWFRGKDLRVSDHAPLRDAAASGEVIPLFVLDPYFFAPHRVREFPHRIQFLLDSLATLDASLVRLGSRLLVVAGRSVDVVPRLASEWSADRVVAHRWVEPFARERDRRVGEALRDRFQLYEGETLLAPGTLRTQTGSPYTVFTAFARAFRRTAAIDEPLPAPKALPAVPPSVSGSTTAIPTCQELGIRRNPAVLEGGEHAARLRLERYLRDASDSYAANRDRMDLDGTSRLSADIKFGTLSIRQVWHMVSEVQDATASGEAFLNELIWREFNYSTLWDRPELLERPFRAEFAGFPWRHDEQAWQAWTAGKTGYPLIDASARQLLEEGFVHNRARMVSASFLSKHLLIDYRRGEAHYMKYLTDGDWAQNNAGWQWSAGCGCDAQPYFRIFNPVIQGQRFDPTGEYVRRWVPELESVPTRYLHRPWDAPARVLQDARIELEKTYPRPIVAHAFARERFLALAARHLNRKRRRAGASRAR